MQKGSTPKLPLPPLRTPQGERPASASQEKTRVGHACEPCRRRKAKCDSGQPVCLRCEKQGLACYYTAGNREKSKRSNQNLTSKVAVYETFLKELVPSLNEAGQQAIHNVLSEAQEYTEPESTTTTLPEGSKGGGEGSKDEHEAGADAGSPKLQDRVRHNAPGFASSTGFLGKASTVRLVEEVGEKLLPHIHFSNDHLDTSNPVKKEDLGRLNRLLYETTSYHVNDLDFGEFGEFGEMVNPFHVPHRATADVFVKAYFSTIHRFFPAVSGPLFLSQYETFWQTSQPPPETDHWLAILNLIFALGSLHTRSVEPNWVDNADRDHVLYFVRARLLTPEPLGMVDLPTIETIQVASLNGMYLIATCQLNRAWHVVGTATRCGQTRGLHLINDSPEMTEAQVELEVRVWHAACSLDTLLGFLTGRPTAIQDKHNSTRGPRPIDDRKALGLKAESPLQSSRFLRAETDNTLSAFIASVALDRIISEILSDVYSANTVKLSWSEVQTMLARFNNKLSTWRAELPGRLTLDNGSDEEHKAPINDRIYLAVRYFSTSILINRPSLCDVDYMEAAIPSQSSNSKSTDHTSAVKCVVSARNLIKLFPNSPNIGQLYGATPWWVVLHYLVQAGAVLTLEIWFHFVHLLDAGDSIIEDVGKVLMWLQAMSKTNHAAFRAWIALSRLLQLAAAGVDKDLDEIDSVATFLPDFDSLPDMEAGSGRPKRTSGSYFAQQGSFQAMQTGSYDPAFNQMDLDPTPQQQYPTPQQQQVEASDFFPDANDVAQMMQDHLGSGPGPS